MRSRLREKYETGLWRHFAQPTKQFENKNFRATIVAARKNGR
jgi:hypothetical protein